MVVVGLAQGHGCTVGLGIPEEGMFDVPGPPRRGGPGTALPKYLPPLKLYENSLFCL